MIYVKHVSLIQSGGVIRDEEATATPETEGADLSDADAGKVYLYMTCLVTCDRTMRGLTDTIKPLIRSGFSYVQKERK